MTSTTLSPHSALLLPVLQSCTLERLQKAVCGLADGSLTITLTRQTETDLRALVKNGDAEYGVTLTEPLTTCSCKDALYRGLVCKHVVAVSLFVLRTPSLQPEIEAPVVAVPVVVASPEHLVWRDGLTVCGSFPGARVHCWPWAAPTLEAACQECRSVFANGYKAHMLHVMSHKTAA